MGFGELAEGRHQPAEVPGAGHQDDTAGLDVPCGTICATWTAPTSPPAPDAPYARIVAANGPKMLALAGEVADGAMPAALPAEFTAHARQVLGPDKLLVVGLSVQGGGTGQAKATARESLSARLSAPSYAARMAALGYSARDIGEVSDRLVDAVVAYGDPPAIAAKVREHRDAGADHVVLLPALGGDFAAWVGQLARLAPAPVSS